MTPNRMLKELGEAASRFNQHTTEHANGCCPICRRFLRDLWQALTDTTNWEPEPVTKQIERLQDELTALKTMQPATRVMTPVAPVESDDTPQGTFFEPPQGRHEEE